MSLLQIRGLELHFGGVRALDRVDLEVERGQVFGIIGPNGSGKTTLLNVITGVYKPTAGSVRMDGVELTDKEPYEIARLGVARTFQHCRVIDKLSALDNVLLGCYGHRNASFADAMFRRRRLRAEVEQLVDQVVDLLAVFSPDLVKRLFDPVADFPYIDRRRVEVCRALAAGPRLLLLDEPTAGMNAEETHEFIGDLSRVRAAQPGMTVAIIEHDMSVIGRVSERVAVLNYGRKIAEGTFGEVTVNQEVQAAYLGGDVVVGSERAQFRVRPR